MYKPNPYKEKALIPNKQIEEMFLRIASDEMMDKYMEHINAKRINLATAYASNRVKEKFFEMIEKQDKGVKENASFIINHWKDKENG